MITADEILARAMDVRAKAMEYGISGGVGKDLTVREATKLARAFNRWLVFEITERPVRDLFVRHLDEIILGALIAKEQMDADIGGEMPDSGQIGVTRPRACYFGIGDDWVDIGSVTTGSPQNWIHSGTTLMGGTAGNPIKIGKNAVHVIFAVGDEAPSSKLESIQFTIDGKEKPIIVFGEIMRLPNSLRIKELEKSFIWRKGTTVLGKVFVSAGYGSSVTTIPYLEGVSYVLEDVLRTHDAANVPGTAKDVVLTT